MSGETVSTDQKLGQLYECFGGSMYHVNLPAPGDTYFVLATDYQKVRGLLEIAKEEHYCGVNVANCSSPFCIAMRAAGEV